MSERNMRVPAAVLVVALAAVTAGDVSAAPVGRPSTKMRPAETTEHKMAATEVKPTQIRATKIGGASANQRIATKRIASELGVQLELLESHVVLTPARLLVGEASMDLIGALVFPARGVAEIVRLGVWGQAQLNFRATAGKRYLVECGVSPADTTWTLAYVDHDTHQVKTTVSGTEHPGFVLTAPTSGRMTLQLYADRTTFSIHGCSITSAQ